MKRMIVLTASALLVGSLFAGCAGRSQATGFRSRAEQIAIQIERAEQMGARECAPRELARAKVQLENAIHEMTEGHYPASWTKKEFDEAEKLAGVMLRERILAERSGFQCFNAGG